MRSQCFYLSTILTVLVLTSRVALGQIASDGSLGTQIEGSGNEYEITGGEQLGGNLFHSFAEFSVPTGKTVSFNYSIDVNNIIGRVTGGAASYIDGLIKTLPGSTANLFLLNPNGIIFGPNAQLNLGGSFLATTATSLVFSDGTEFRTQISSTPSLLTLSVPIGLQFGSQPGEIINRSQVGLQVQANQTLALVGGNVTLEGSKLSALGGAIELGSVGDNSFVNLTPFDKGWQLDYQNVDNFQDIQVSNKSLINASGPGGIIQIQARKFTLLTGSQIGVGPVNDQDGGNLEISASESVDIIGFPQRRKATGIFNQVLPNTTGNGGNIIINTQYLRIQDGGLIDTSTLGQGTGGQIIINAQKLVELRGVNAFTPSALNSAAAFLRPEDETATGDGGQIIINTGRLVVADGAEILAVTVTPGNGGIINIRASESVEVTGTGFVARDMRLNPSIISTSSGFETLDKPSKGKGGNLSINTNRLVVSDGGQINAGSFQGGEAGNLTINAGSILLNNGKLLAESTSGSGGNIFISASGLLVLRNNSLISATAGTEGAGGDGGNIFINAQFILAVPGEDSDIEANAFTGSGGNVNITTNALLGIQFRENTTDLSDITVSSEFGNSGVFSLNRPDVDPQSGLVTLPSEVVDAENVIVQACGVGGAYTRGEFVIVGRGGFSPDPYDNLELNIGLPDLGDSAPNDHSSLSSTQTTVRSSSPTEPIIEAQGWVLNREGKIVLTAQVKNTNTGDYKNNPAICNPLPEISQSQ